MILVGFEDMLSLKFFENLHSMMAILVLLEQVLRQIVFENFSLNFKVFNKYRYDAIFSHVFERLQHHKHQVTVPAVQLRFH